MERIWAEHSHFLLKAPTGSGKSTRVAVYLDEWLGGTGRIVILQPRRVAARMLAHRVAGECGEAPGGRVGYAMRHAVNFSAATRILYATEGWFLRNLLDGNGLNGIYAVLFDEFHERHVEGELCLGWCRWAVERGWAGKIGILSATLEGMDELRAYLGDAGEVVSGGRVFPVEVEYLGEQGQAPLWDAAVTALRKALVAGAQADVLVFLPGKRELRRCGELLREQPWLRGWEICQLHGELPLEEQSRLIRPGDRPRVLLSTNIAETSLTLPGVRTVVDSGWVRMAGFDPRRGINTLHTVRISRSSAEQRSGRAGRVAAGRCYRMWSRREHEHMVQDHPPELQRLDLAAARLSLMEAGMEADFPWLQPPPATAWQSALALLRLLGAVDVDGVTAVGRMLARLAMHPRHGRIMVEAQANGSLQRVLVGLAILEGRSLLMRVTDRRLEEARDSWFVGVDDDSDLLCEVVAFERIQAAGGDDGFCRQFGLHHGAYREAEQWIRQVRAQCDRLGWSRVGEGSAADFCCALLSGYPDQLACQIDRATLRYRRSDGKVGVMRRESRLHAARLIISADCVESELAGNAVVLLGMNTRIEEEWLKTVYPAGLREQTVTVMNEAQRRLEGQQQLVFNGLVIRETVVEAVDAEAAASLITAAVIAGRWPLKRWDAAVEQWIARVNTLAHYCPDLEIAPIGSAERLLIIEQLVHGKLAYKQVKDLDVWPVLQQWLPAGMDRLLDQWAPVRFALPDGRTVKLRYESGGKVVLSAKIQQLYDVPGSQLSICNGRCRLLVELLAPNQRPVQLTDDLDAFWTGAYPAVRKELFGRYPRHEWR